MNRFVCGAALLTGCESVDPEQDDVGSRHVEDTSLTSDFSIGFPDGMTTIPGFTEGPFTLAAGEVSYLTLQGTVYQSSFPERALDTLQLHCGSRSSRSNNRIFTTENYPEPRNPSHPDPTVTRVARMLVVGPGTFTCWGKVSVGASNEDDDEGTHIYKAGNTATFLVRRDKSAGKRWGTEYEENTAGTMIAYPDECCVTEADCRAWGGVSPMWKCRRALAKGEFIPCLATWDEDCMEDGYTYEKGIYIGPDSDLGNDEYVLHSGRFEVPVFAPSFDVWSEPELTTCPRGSYSCPTYREGSEAGIGATVQLDLLVQQMCSPTSSAVAITRTYSSTFVILHPEHHKKAHLHADDVPFVTTAASCPGLVAFGRSFLVQTKVTWISGANVKVEYGTNGSNGYSTGFYYSN